MGLANNFGAGTLPISPLRSMSHGGGIQERIPSRPGSTPASPGVQERIGALRIGGGAVGSPRSCRR